MPEKKTNVAPWGLGGFGPNFSLFGENSVPNWVDTAKNPGTTSQAPHIGLKKTINDVRSTINVRLSICFAALCDHVVTFILRIFV